MQYRLSLILVILLGMISGELSGQLTGSVYDHAGEALSFVTVYVEGTSKGTVSNLEGEYSLELEPGEYTIIYKYIGYAEHKEVIDFREEMVKNVTLLEKSIALSEVLVTADGEDPAYRVIREAIRHRDQHKKAIKKYQADVYVKGVVKMLKAPEKVLGQEVGDLEGMLDTTGQGIVYLAESQSKIYFHEPDLYKEEMYSSIVAEDDGSFNFNRFIGANYDIYEEYYEFSRSIMNPLADNAMLFYRYKMLETRFDQDGRLVNRIQVIPKSSARPTMFGEIYIIEDTWNVKELELSFTGKAIKEPFFDTIRLRQVHLPVQDDKWKVFSQTMDFKLGAFGFKVGGAFTYVFSDYDIDPPIDPSFFDNEEFRMDESAIKTDSSFWAEVRPIKLTEEEKNNYIKKDSLKKLWASKTYQDSVDRENNKVVWSSLLFGYTHSNTHKKRYFSYTSPLTTYAFNPVTGSAIQMGLTYTKLDSLEQRRLRIGTDIGYGFGDKRLKVETTISLQTDRKFWETWTLRVGDANRQLNALNPVHPLIETWRTLMYKDYQGRYYRKQYVGIQYQREVANGIFFRGGLTYARRSSLRTVSDYSFFNRDALYDTNHPLTNNLSGDFFNSNNDLRLTLNMRIRIGQKYSSFPKFRLRNPSNWPDLWVRYDKGIAIADTDYDKLSIRLTKDNINYRLLGHSNINIVASTFLNDKQVTFIDQHHFLSNINSISVRSRYMRGFKMMPHYTYSTTNDYVAGFYEHHLDGYLLDLIPLVNRLGWKTVIGGNALIRDLESNYYEWSAGIADIKIGSFSLFRLDYVWSYDDEGLLDRGFLIGLSSLFE